MFQSYNVDPHQVCEHLVLPITYSKNVVSPNFTLNHPLEVGIRFPSLRLPRFYFPFLVTSLSFNGKYFFLFSSSRS